MKSIYLMFTMMFIGMISITSCTAEMEQPTAEKNKNVFSNEFSKTYEEELAEKAVQEYVEGVYDETTSKPKINCIRITRGYRDQINAHACVTVGNYLVEVNYTGGYTTPGGDQTLPVSIGYIVSTCNC